MILSAGMADGAVHAYFTLGERLEQPRPLALRALQRLQHRLRPAVQHGSDHVMLPAG